MNINEITGKEVREAVDWLWSNRENGGCFHHVCWIEDDDDPHPGREWCICIGWDDGYSQEPEPGDYQDGSWRIVAGIRYQGANNCMQTDLNIDFQIPSLNDGDCYDLSVVVSRGSDWEQLAEQLNNYAAMMFKTMKDMGKEFA